MTDYICEMSGKNYLERIRKNPVVIIPTGACEVYGRHLPLGSDILVAKKIAEILAEKTGAVIAPAVECGESSALQSFACTFPMPREVLSGYVDFLLDKFMKDGVKSFIFVTGHAGNVPVIDYAIKKKIPCGIRACQFDWWRMTNALSGELFDWPGGHAAECGTSVMMYLYPDLVDMDSYEGFTPMKNDFPEFTDYAPFTEKTENGCIGFAEKASPEKGKAIIERCVQRMMEYLCAKGYVKTEGKKG